MKNLIYILLLGIFIISCSTTKNLNDNAEAETTVSGDTIKIANDSLEYKVIIIEPGFDTWLITQAKPRTHYTKDFLEAKNRQWISTYNSRVANPIQNSELYPHEINYEYDVDYGFEVNYMLYNYLLYFQEKYNQDL